MTDRRCQLPAMLVAGILSAAEPIADEDVWLRGSFRVLTKVSAGRNSFFDIAQIARETDIDFIVFSDQFIVRGEYGLPPFRNVLKVVRERDSIATYGISNYLEDMQSAQRQTPEVILVPGADVAPIYEWSGSPFGDSVVCKKWSQQITVVGKYDERFFHKLPVIHNDPIAIRFPQIFIHVLPLLGISIGVILVRRATVRYYDRQGHSYSIYDKPQIVVGLVIGFTSFIWLLDNRPLRERRYSQYRDNGVQPYQELIDYVRENGGLTFWSHPEMEMSGEYGPFLFNRFGRVRLLTTPYLDDIERSYGHNGLAGIYGDRFTAHLPGGVWDRMLNDYCRGVRKIRPVVVGEIDYHMDRPLDLICTVVRVREKSLEAIVDALRDGRSYAIGGGSVKSLRLDDARIVDGDRHAALGETLTTSATAAHLRLSGVWNSPGDHQRMPVAKLNVVVNGTLTAERPILETPFAIDEKLTFDDNFGCQYVRFYMSIGNDILLANPIFIEKPGR